MAQMLVRDLDDEVRDRLRERARAHGRSMEAEVRDILTAVVMTQAVEDTTGLGTRIARLFADGGPDELASDWHSSAVRPITFDE